MRLRQSFFQTGEAIKISEGMITSPYAHIPEKLLGIRKQLEPYHNQA